LDVIMKAPTTPSRFRLSVLTPLICGFLCLFLATGALASDPDDDWGLPTAPSEDDEDSSSADIQIGSEVIEVAPESELGVLTVDRADHESTSFEQGADPSKADVVPVEAGAPVRVKSLDDGLAMQGRLLLNLPYNGEGTLRATIRSPENAVEVRALLSVDHLGSLDELLADADPSGVPTGVSTLLPVGEVAVVNLNAFKKLVDSYGYVVGDGYVSVVVLSTDIAGHLHVSAARISAAGGPMEVLIR
jgi:hypothetical protein